MSDIDNRHLERLLKVAEQQAASTSSLVEIQRRNEENLGSLRDSSHKHTTLLETLCGHMERMDEGRGKAVVEVKEHISEKVSASNRWLHLWSAMIVGFLGLAAALITWSLAKQH